MATQWIDYAFPTAQRPSWLLMNGERIECPELEVTTAFRKIRLKHYPEVNGWFKNATDVVNRGADRIARAKRTRVWMQINPDQSIPTLRPAELHYLRTDGRRGTSTALWYFKHESLPLVAVLKVALETTYYRHELRVTLEYPSTHPDDRHEDKGKRLIYKGVPDSRWPEPVQYMAWGEEGLRNEREAAMRFAQQVHCADDLDSIEIPDLRDPDDPDKPPKWLKLTLVQSNVGGEFLQSLSDYLNTSDKLSEAYEAFQNFRSALRGAGIALDNVAQESFVRALAGNNPEQLTTKLGPVSAPASSDQHDNYRRELGYDTQHTIDLHLASGTMTVNCPLRVDEEQMAEEWKLARFEAEMQGELDAFLGFHTAFTAKEGEARTKRVLSERKA